MEAVLFVFFLLAFVLVAPPNVVAITATGLIFASLVVQTAASALCGVRVSLAASFRTLVLAFLLSMLAIFTIMSFMIGAPPEFKHALANPLSQLFTFGAYVLGFRLGLGLRWPHAALVSALSSAIIGACLWAAVALASSGVN